MTEKMKLDSVFKGDTGPQGIKGDKGLQGERGLPGKDGVSPSISDVTNKLKSDTTFKDGVVNILKFDDVFKTSMTEKMKLDSDFQSIIVKAIGTSDEMLKNTLTARDIALKAQDKAELAKYKAIKAKVAAESAQKDAEGEKNFAIKKAGEAQKYYKNVDAMNKNFVDMFCHMEQNKNSKFCTSRKKRIISSENEDTLLIEEVIPSDQVTYDLHGFFDG